VDLGVEGRDWEHLERGLMRQAEQESWALYDNQSNIFVETDASRAAARTFARNCNLTDALGECRRCSSQLPPPPPPPPPPSPSPPRLLTPASFAPCSMLSMCECMSMQMHIITRQSRCTASGVFAALVIER